MKKTPTYKTAIALAYDGADDTPRLALKEEHLSADAVKKLADRYGIPVVDRPDLVQALRTLEIDQEIPQEVYEAVALLLNEIEERTSK